MTTNNNGNNNVEVETTNDETENDQTPLSSSSTIPIPTASGDDEVHVITTNHVVPHIPTPRRHSPQPPTTATPRYPPPPRPSNRPRHRRPWRFIRHAKKTAGYSTSSAGRIVEGLTSEELAATYVPPRLDSEGNDKEAREVGRLDIVDSGVVAVDNDGGGGGGGGKWRRCLDRTCNEDEDEEKVSEDSSVENSRVFAQAMDGCVKVECDSASQVKVITELTAVSKDEQESDKLTNDVSITEEINSNDCQTIPSDNKPITINDSAIIPSPNKEPLTNNRKRNRACLLLVFLLIAMVGMILGVTIGNSNESESAIQRKGAEAAVDVNGKDAAPPMSAPSLSLVNGTSNPSTTLGAFSSLAPSWNRSMPPSGTNYPTFPPVVISSSLSPMPAPTNSPVISSMPPMSSNISWNSPTIRPILVEQITDYEFTGIGFCQDSLGNRYDSYQPLLSTTNIFAGCGESCVKNDAFRGILIESRSRCSCLYDDAFLYGEEWTFPLVMNPALSLEPGEYTGGSITVGGVGEIVSSDGDASAMCYRYGGDGLF
eukprot:CCRYP_020197-RB/>CCRYP_020197-RB protein AED:0.05 eAED:0.05 QI:198/1/1/1/1/1/3/272/540